MLKRNLGKGLSALIDEAIGPMDGNVVEISLSEIAANKNQPRTTFNDESLAELADSIAENGLIQPIIVRKDGDVYRIIAGERRFRAAKLCGMEKIDCIVRDMNEYEASKVAIIENIQREDLNPLEEARAYKLLIERYSLTQEALAKSLGKSRSYITNFLRLLNLPDEVQDSIMDEELSFAHGRLIAGIADVKTQKEVAKKASAEKLSVKDTKTLIDRKQNKQPRQVKQNYVIKEIEESLTELLGTKVELQGSENRGRVCIDYYSSEDLEGIIELLNRG